MAIMTDKWVILRNNQALRSRDNAGTGLVSILKVDTSDEIELLTTVNYTDATHGKDELANKSYVSALLEGRKPKEAVRVASTGANIDLSTGGLLTVDTIVLVAGDRVLVKDQTDASENGIYVAALGAWSRADDFDELSPVDEINGAYTAVQEGSANAGKTFVQSGTVATLGTDDIDFVFYNSVSTLVGGDGIDITGSTISVDLDTNSGLEINSTKLRAKTDESTIERDATNGLQIKDLGVSTAKIAADAVTDAKIRLTNDGYLRARNNAGDGDIDMIKVTTGDEMLFASFPLTPSAAPDADYEVANKKYVDDQIGLVDKTTLSQEIITLDATDISNQYIDLAAAAESAASIQLVPVDGPMQEQGVDYTVSLTGGAGGVTRITFAGDLATGGDAALVATEKLMIFYAT